MYVRQICTEIGDLVSKSKLHVDFGFSYNKKKRNFYTKEFEKEEP